MDSNFLPIALITVNAIVLLLVFVIAYTSFKASQQLGDAHQLQKEFRSLSKKLDSKIDLDNPVHFLCPNELPVNLVDSMTNLIGRINYTGFTIPKGKGNEEAVLFLSFLFQCTIMKLGEHKKSKNELYVVLDDNGKWDLPQKASDYQMYDKPIYFDGSSYMLVEKRSSQAPFQERESHPPTGNSRPNLPNFQPRYTPNVDDRPSYPPTREAYYQQPYNPKEQYDDYESPRYNRNTWENGRDGYHVPSRPSRG